MKNINNCQAEDLVQHPEFRKWVLGKLPPENTFWPDWLAEHPEKKALVEEARSLVIASGIEEIYIPDTRIREGIAGILRQTQVRQPKWYYRKPVRIAALLFVFAGLGLLAFPYLKENLKTPENRSITQETENNSLKPLSLKLSDGTWVKLQKGSKLEVARDFGQQTRRVYLTGEAFFEVQKDVHRPFLVYAGGVVTKVLGTSFTIRAYQRETRTSVDVRTGHVTVYPQEKAGTGISPHPEQILLTPNQKVVFEKEKGKLVKTLVEKPVVVTSFTEKNPFDFNETPIPQVLTVLQRAYGVKIVFDAELLEKCTLNAVFSTETLYEQIDMICETIQARYEIADGQIVIYARGCK